jgi:hypothetical protein
VTTAAAKFVSFGSPLQQAVSPKVDGGPQATATGHRWTRRPQTTCMLLSCIAKLWLRLLSRLITIISPSPYSCTVRLSNALQSCVGNS